MNKKPTNYVVLSEMRAGSHMVMNLLNSHPAVHCNGDFLTPDIEWNGLKWLKDVGFSDNGSSKELEAVGFLLKTKTDYYHQFLKRVQPKVIFLVRENQLETFVSRQMAKEFGCYTKDSNGVKVRYEDAPKVREKASFLHIDKEELLKYFKEQRVKRKRTERFLTDYEFIQISYEDLCMDAVKSMSEIYRFIGVGHHEATFTEGWGNTKLDTRSTKESIANYDEMKDFFSTKYWKKYF